MYDDFGHRLRILREAQRWTQEEVGNKINRSKGLISLYENNLSIPTGEILIELALLFNVSLDFLVGIEKNEMISVKGLTAAQKNLIYTLIFELKDNTSGLSRWYNWQARALV